MSESGITDSASRAMKRRVKTGDELTPTTTFKPLAAPGKLNVNKYDDADFLRAHPRYIHEDLMRLFVASKTPICLWGPVGAGKTRNIEALGNETDEDGVPYQVITVAPSTMDPTSIMGLMVTKHDPVAQKEIMIRSTPEIAQQVWDYYNDRDGLTIMFLDEMTTCIPATQNAMLGLLTHGQFGNMDISPYTSFIMAANPPGTVQTVLPLSEAVINRAGHIPWYSDGKIWYDKWETGFGKPSKEPDPKTKQFISKLIDFNEYAFRADPANFDDEEDMWRVEDLIPWQQMNFSERSLDEASKVYQMMQHSLSEVSFEARKLYVTEAMKAMLGNRAAELSEKIEDMLETLVGTKPAVDALDKYSITNSTTTEELVGYVGDSLHRNRGKLMTAEQTHDLAETFRSEIFANGGFMLKRYTAFWIWVSSAPSESARSPIIPVATDVLQRATAEYRHQMSERDLFPTFIPDTVRREIREMFQMVRNRV